MRRIEENWNTDVTHINVSQNERWIHLAGGAALLGLGMKTNGLVRMGLMAFGSGLMYVALSGQNPLYRPLHRNSALQTQSVNVSVPQEQGQHVSKTITINRPADYLYGYWRNFANLPRIMKHLESVTLLEGDGKGSNQSHWKAKAPLGMTVEWDAEIINEVPNETIAWRSLPGAQIPNAGSVHFKALTHGRGTELKVELEYMPPAGKLGATVAKLLGEEPQVQIEDDLRHFKQLMETGEIATVDGQSSGREAQS